MIVLDDVSHSYGDRPVLRGVSAELTERRIGIIGANGSGKSTLARTFNGLVVPDQGEVRTLGMDVRSKRSEVRSRVGFMFADASAQIVMPTPAEDVALSLRPAGRRRRRGDDPETAARVAAILAEFGLGDHADSPAQLMSSGQKQMLAFASVLVTEPEILVCDEPTTLLDLRNVIKVRARLAALEQQVILLTHHLEMLDDFDRVLVMDDGALVFDGAPAEAVSFYRRLAAR